MKNLNEIKELSMIIKRGAKMKKFDRIEAVDYYIKGEYHCDKCPFCWGGGYMPECDDYDDAGCYIFGDLRDTCRLIPPIRFILGWGRRKRTEYFRAHKYDDFSEWYAEKKKVCKMTIERFQDQYGIREIHGSCIFMNEYLLYQRDFKQEKKISYESFQIH